MTNDPQAKKAMGAPEPIGAVRRRFHDELSNAVHDPGRSGMPGSASAMLRNLAAVVLDAHELDTKSGFCEQCVHARGSEAQPVEWPCDEIVRMGRIYGVWWVRP